MSASPESPTPEPSGEDRPQAGPPELEHLLERMKRDEESSESADAADDNTPPPSPSLLHDLTEAGQLRSLASVLIIASLPAVLYGADLRPPFNSAALAAGGGLFLVSAWLEFKLGQRFLMCACLGAGGVLIARALAAL